MGSILSIDIGKKNIHIAEGSYTKSSIIINKAVTVSIPEGCLNGDSIVNPGVLIESITDTVKKYGFIKEAIITIDAYNAVVRDISLPSAKVKETDDMIKTEMIQTYNILPTDIIQYKLIENDLMENGIQLMKYRAASIDKEIVESYHNLLLDSKLKPIAMDININAIDKLMSRELTINDMVIKGVRIKSWTSVGL